MDAFIPKPFRLEDITETYSNLLKEKRKIYKIQRNYSSKTQEDFYD